MVDIPGNATTTTTISVGGSISDVLETPTDRDWIRIELVAGQQIVITLSGTGPNALEDPYLYLRNSAGVIIEEDDDGGDGLNSRIVFTVTTSGTYYIDVGSWEGTEDGTYTVEVQPWTPPPVGSLQDIANQLTHGYWNGDYHHFNVTQGGSITVNLTQLTAAGQTLARAALQLWSDIIGVNFVEVSTGGQITFDDNEEGAFASSSWSNHIISTSHVNISLEWLDTYGTGLNTYSMQTYIHEIGHALGLGHAGDYNSTADYPEDASYANEGWPTSVMSYFSQTENDYFSSQGFQYNYALTPMGADILAMAFLYGLSTTTRTGNDTYGPGWTATMGVITLFDTGGTDMIDVADLIGNHMIDLNPGAFSNVIGERGNIWIAPGTTIENARGGLGNDTLIGNSANNFLEGGDGDDILVGGAGNDILEGGTGIDTLTGGTGNDIFRGTSVDLNGDTIADFSSGDSIVITNANPAAFTFSVSGNTLTYTGGTLTFGAPISGTIIASPAAGGGVQLTLSAAPDDTVDRAIGRAGDFNGDGRDDILWRHESGLVATWLGLPNGGFTPNSTAGVGTEWRIVGLGDFNGDGRDDILWRNASGDLTNWLAQPNGSFLGNSANSLYGVPTSWHVAGIGDFNGDGRDDILWRNDSGVLANWLGQANGSFTPNTTASVSTDWHVVGVGDFNGDGRDDVLWRHSSGLVANWLGQANGSFTPNSSAGAGTDWHVVGVGDFNGDGRDDILWRNDNGSVINWLGQPNGSFVGNSGNAFYAVSTDWEVASVGDFNGDGRDDVLWRDSSGGIRTWLGQSNGGLAANPGTSFFQPTSWQVAGTGDFNGDGRADVVWRHDSGTVNNWLGQVNGFVPNATSSSAGTEWHIAGVGDFNGDGRDDVLWRNDSGALTNWLGQPDGSFVGNAANSYYELTTSWNVAGVGDFNGDGRDDILWRHDSGLVANWLGQANGSFTPHSSAGVGTEWQIAGVGDFNGDGRDDILWRNGTGDVTNWLGQANGTFVGNSANALYGVPTSWHIVGVGDFNGDGRDDILWRNDNGDVTNWLGQANGGFAGNGGVAYYGVANSLQVAGIGDFNGDGRDDILWRNSNGDYTTWLGQANGGFAGNLGTSSYHVDNSWHVQPMMPNGADWFY